ncbi:DUF6701 domain-containing protein [Marinobacter halophilus]|uniref:DUF6701 domain-containing protein n=1 Tax=Marinobacter halophilus TaxID=1323740 RepID=A0A2T1KG34_9GAMM|nr:DUF6701 domain-containing protein [Marinobacter halophilus]PSF09086.1 hypothetical protein C7H08_05685 [Marinobacter halophilus]GGC83536.1 hypothetical protein GCM10011362_34920 [Marinobacter halophilus]
MYPPREFAKNQNNINFTVDGRARVLVDGDLIINGNNFTMNENGDPANLLLIVDGNLEFNNNAKLNAIIYVTGDVEFNQNPIVVGAIASEGSITGIADSEVTFNEEVISRADFGGACISEDLEVVIDHFRIFHPSTALTCTPAQDIRVRACSNPECTTLFSEQVTVSLSPESGWLQGNTVSFVGETNELAFRSVSAGPATLGFLNSTVSAEGTPPLKCFADKGTSGKCEIVFSESGLLLNAPDHTSAEEVQVSILGVKAGETDPGQCVPAFTGEKTIEFMASYQNPLSGMRVPESAGTSLSGGSLVLDFDGSGAASFPMRYRDVGSVLLQARYDGTGDEADLIIEGQDSFIARPDRFEVVVSGNPGTPDVTNENMFREAGEGFDVEVRALNALGEMTPNFGQESPREAVRLTVEEAPGIPLVNMPQLDGALELFGSFCTTPEPGKACGQFVWPEVGTFSLLPSLISGAYLGTENVEGRLLPYVGRFIPARFEIAIDPGRFSSTPLSTNRTSCTEERSWVYTGEPFGWDMAPEVVITPKNRNGVTVQNYAGTLFQRVGVDDVGFAPFPVEDEAATGVGGTPLDLEAALAPATLLPDTSGSLIYRFATDDEFRYPKTLNARVSGYTPEPVFSLEGLIDADGVTVLDPTENLPEVFKPVADFEIRYGRVALDNGYGPENLDLVIPLRAEVFGSGGFQLHQDEICWFYDLPKDTSVDFAASTFTSGQTGVVEVADVELSLEDGRPRKTAVEDYRLRLSAPAPSGAESVQARGIYVELDTGSDWLKDFWDADNQEALVNPYAWATFGVYRGNDRIIYWREVPTN